MELEFAQLGRFFFSFAFQHWNFLFAQAFRKQETRVIVVWKVILHSHLHRPADAETLRQLTTTLESRPDIDLDFFNS